jgi:purine-binding chemotaxis protein CheW
MTMMVLLVLIGDQLAAIEATHVETVADIAAVVPVPLAPPHVLGVAAIRSEVVTVVEPGRLVGAAPVAPTGRVVVCAIDGHRYGFRFDAVEDVAQCTPADVGALRLDPIWSRMARAVVLVDPRFALLLDPEQLVGTAAAQPGPLTGNLHPAA